MAFCPSSCSDYDLINVSSGSCLPAIRYNAIKRLGFYKCSTVLPNPVTCLNLTPLVTAGEIAFSNPLANVEIGEPQTEERIISDCLPTLDVIVSRDINFQDRIAVDVNNLGAASPFADWAFWKNKRDNALLLNYFFVMCDGSLIIPREAGVNRGLAATFLAFINFEKVTTGQGAIEFKQIRLKFKDDPFDFTAPQINLNTCADLAQYA